MVNVASRSSIPDTMLLCFLIGTDQISLFIYAIVPDNVDEKTVIRFVELLII